MKVAIMWRPIRERTPWDWLRYHSVPPRFSVSCCACAYFEPSVGELLEAKNRQMRSVASKGHM